METYNAETVAERRMYPRYPLKLNVAYQMSDQTGTRSFLSQSITRDLGVGGIALLTEEWLETGQLLQVRIGLPRPETARTWTQMEQSPPADKHVVLTSRVVWRQRYDAQRFLIGVQFLDLEQDAARQLKSFLEEFQLQDAKMDNEE